MLLVFNKDKSKGAFATYDRAKLLKEGATLTPRAPVALKLVVKDETGAPLEGATVSLTRWFNRSGGFGGRTTTDDKGEAVFSDLYHDGSYSWNVSLDEYLDYSSKLPGSVVGSANWKSVQEVVLKKADIAQGRVVDDKGKPLVGADVIAMAWSRIETRTDADGNFKIAVPEGDNLGWERGPDGSLVPATVWIKVVHSWRDLGSFAAIQRDKLVKDGIEITAVPARPMTVVVKTPDGKPIEGVEIVSGARFGDHGEGGRIRYTDAKGEVVVSEVYVGGDYGIIAQLDGYHQVTGDRIPRVGGPEWKNRVEVIMECTNRTQKGRVVDAEGKPVAGATVTASVRGEVSTQTDASGNFTLKGLPGSKIMVYARSGDMFGIVEVSKDSGDVTIQLKKRE